MDNDLYKNQLKISTEIVEDLKKIGEIRGCRVSSSVQTNSAPENIILETAHREKVDLIVIGSDVRPASGRLYLGPRIERVLKNAPCPVVILNST